VSRRAKTLTAWAVGVLLLLLALRGVDASRLRESITQASPGWLLVALAVYLSAYLVRSLRWRIILKPIQKVSVGESFSMMMAGYFLNYVIPVRAGELAKSFFLKKLHGTPIATSLPTVFVDKLFELLSVVLVIVMIPVLAVDLTAPLVAIVAIVLAVFLAAIALLVFAFRNEQATARVLSRLFAWLPARLHERLRVWLHLFVRGMAVAREHVRVLPVLVALTGAAVLLDATYFSLMFKAFSVDVAFPKVLFGYTLLSLSYILPTPPAQIGYNELVIGLIFAGGLAGPGTGRSEIMAVVVVAHALTGALIAAAGLWSFGAMGIRVSDSFRRLSRGGEAGAAPMEPGRDL
jgi:uncharacterized protein (TIRG00374 family)